MPRNSPQPQPLEISLAQDLFGGPTNARTLNGRSGRDRGERYTFRFGDREVEVTVLDLEYRRLPGANGVVQEWVREVERVERLRSKGRGLGARTAGGRRVVGISCRRHVPCPYRVYPKQREAAKNGGGLPVSILAVCAGGTHCLVVELPDVTDRYFHYSWYDRSLVPGSLRAFLSDPRLLFAGYGVQRDAARLQKDWGVVVANPRELRLQVDRAFWVESRLGGMFKRREKVGVEALAREVLGGVRVEEEPYGCNHYYSHVSDEDRVMYVIRDACLAFEIGSRCQDIIKWAEDKKRNDKKRGA